MPRTAVALALMLLVPTAFALDPLDRQDDAGSGGDAPDSWREAALVAPGEHGGAMDATLDAADWYRTGPIGGQKMRLEWRASSSDLYAQVRDDAGALLWQGYSQGGTSVYLSVVGGSYRVGFVADEGSVDAAYSFRLDLATPPAQQDGGLPGDAPGPMGGVREVGAAAGVAGLLHPATGDSHDAYGITPPAGKRVTATLSVPEGGRAHLSAYDAAGFHVGTVAAQPGPVAIAWGGNLRRLVVSTDAPAATSYAVALAYADPPAQDDAGTGADAPADAALAPLLAPGAYAGRLESWDGDARDAYRVSAPPGHGIRVTLEVVEGAASFALLGDDGSSASGLVQRPTSYTILGRGVPSTLVVDRYGIAAFTSYRLLVEAAPIGDVVVRGVTVDDAPPSPDEPFVRNIRVQTANLGAGTYHDGPLVVTLYTVSGLGEVAAEPLVYDEGFTLAPWEEREIVIPWDTTLFVGEFRLSAIAYGDELNPSGQEVWTRIHAPNDPGLGRGVGFDHTWYPRQLCGYAGACLPT